MYPEDELLPRSALQHLRFSLLMEML